MASLPESRVGMIIPSSNRLVEPELNRLLPAGFSLHVTRARMTGRYELPLQSLLPVVRASAQLLADAGCQVICFHCNRSSVEDGTEGDRQIRGAIEQASGSTPLSTSRAVAHALVAVEAARIVLVTPYSADFNEQETAFLIDYGVEVVQERALGLAGIAEYTMASPETWFAATLEARHPRADAYLLSCTAIRSTEVIGQLEAALGRPVITSNQAALWAAVRLCWEKGAISGLGRLGELAMPGNTTR